MYKLCKTEQSARRQRQLELGLLKAMQQRNYEEISISELCQSMGVPRKTFYRYFSSKEGTLYALIDHTLMEFEDFDRESRLTGKRTIQRDLERFFRFWQQNGSLIAALDKSGLSGVLFQRAVDYALTEVTSLNRFLPDESRDVQNNAVMFAVFGLLAMVMRWHNDGYRTPVPELTEMAERLLTRPLFPEAAQLI